jgi:hypothetical protein
MGSGCEGNCKVLSRVATMTAQAYLRNEVGLELVQIDIKGTIEAQRGGNRGNDLSN